MRVVVLGGGHAGATVASRLAGRAEVTVVSEENSLLFTPMLAEVAAGDLDPRHIITPIRQLAPGSRLIQGRVESVDVGAKTVRVRPRFGLPAVEIGGDALVIALGSVPATFGVPGVTEHALFFKTISDALRIRNRLLALLEAASVYRESHLTKVAVVGAGYSGSELAAALADLLIPASRRYFREVPPPKVTLVDAVARVTPALPKRLSRIAERALRNRGVELVLGRKVQEVDVRGLVLEDGQRVEAATVVWVAGVQAHPLGPELGLPLDRGRLVVDGHMQAATGIFALGDMAAVPDGFGGISPPTGQSALRQGKYLGRHLPDLLEGRRVRAFRDRSLGELVSLGHRNAVGRVMGIPVSGFPAWFLWRSYYLFRLPSPLRKARVALDWLLDLIFPPDIAWLPSSDLGPDPD